MHHFGVIAQLVEQRIENPCVGSSILPLATILKKPFDDVGRLFCLVIRWPLSAVGCVDILVDALQKSAVPCFDDDGYGYDFQLS